MAQTRTTHKPTHPEEHHLHTTPGTTTAGQRSESPAGQKKKPTHKTHSQAQCPGPKPTGEKPKPRSRSTSGAGRFLQTTNDKTAKRETTRVHDAKIAREMSPTTSTHPCGWGRSRDMGRRIYPTKSPAVSVRANKGSLPCELSRTPQSNTPLRS